MLKRCIIVIFALLLCLPISSAQAESALLITEECSITLPQGLEQYTWRITDGYANSYIELNESEKMVISSLQNIGGILLK